MVQNYVMTGDVTLVNKSSTVVYVNVTCACHYFATARIKAGGTEKVFLGHGSLHNGMPIYVISVNYAAGFCARMVEITCNPKSPCVIENNRVVYKEAHAPRFMTALNDRGKDVSQCFRRLAMRFNIIIANGQGQGIEDRASKRSSWLAEATPW